MSADESRRFTDREVALVLRKASEIEETSGGAGGGGLSLSDLQDIGREVGISPAAIAQAAAAVEGAGRRSALFRPAPLVRRTVHAVPGELNEEAVAALVRLVDERADTTGSVSEALGSVRWTGGDRFWNLQVSVTPRAGETTIQVVEKAAPRLRRFMAILPTAWGAMLAVPAVAGLHLPGVPGAGVLALGAVVGATVGRLVWGVLSARSEAKVSRLAADLTREANEAASRGLLARTGNEGAAGGA
jgi:hypothetical protein